MKKTITRKGIALSMLLAAALASNAQEKPKMFGKYPLVANEYGVVRCASTEYDLIRKEKNQKLASDNQFEAWMSQKVAELKEKKKNNQKSGTDVLVIPVVVHVVFNGGDNVGFNENLSLARVQSQIDVLNEDFGKVAGTNGDDQTGFGVDTKIQFCLAKIDPEGNITDGVDRVPTTTATYMTMGDVDVLKSNTIWDTDKYMNVWTVVMGGDISSLLGYAQFPDYDLSGLQESGQDSDPLHDGVVINYKNFGSAEKVSGLNSGYPYNLGRTATHEIGHFLGLRHIWGDATNCQGNDYCNDTPKQTDKSSGCPAEGTDTCPQSGVDMWQNYMDYTNDECMSVFTQNQMDRMQIILLNAPRRASLLTSGVCGILATPEAEILLGTKVYPNPTQNVLNITVDNGDLPDAYVIYNSIGQLIASAKITSEANLTVDTSSYSNGIYFIKIDKGAETKTIKFIKN